MGGARQPDILLCWESQHLFIWRPIWTLAAATAGSPGEVGRLGAPVCGGRCQKGVVRPSWDMGGFQRP